MRASTSMISSFRAAAALALFASLAACTSDPGDHGPDGGAGSTGSGGSGGTGGGGSGGAFCASPITVPAASPGIANFDMYDGATALGSWSFPLGGDSTLGVYAGPFSYGDRASGFPETFDMTSGENSMYALRIADTLAQSYGGGMGTWLSACINAVAFRGISFWAKGTSPTGKVKLTLSMQETLPVTPSTPDSPVGTCTGTTTTCVHPSYTFTLTNTWTKIEAPWSAFTGGNAAGMAVAADGHNITQIQFGVELVWTPDATGTYVPTPAPYELAVDSLTFY